MRGANEDGCISSMYMIGKFFTQPNYEGRQIHLGYPWFLEGSIRGSIDCAKYLVTNIYFQVRTATPIAFLSYWMKMMKEWANYDDLLVSKSDCKSKMNECTEIMTRECAICKKIDTDTFVLRQCNSCNLYCYCSKECQTIHWKKPYNHKRECKQINILNTYHKPYAQEIREAAICGQIHPAVEILRSQLGLNRPIQDYEELVNDIGGLTTNVFKDPTEYLVARNDGTVWIGSTPNPIGRRPTTTTVPARASSAKDDQSYDGVD